MPTLLKAALPSIPVVNQLPGVRKEQGADPSTLRFSRGGVIADRDHAAAYARVCGFPVKDTVPLTYPHLLAFPLHMEAMTSPQFPFPAIGSVHVENSITSHRPIVAGESLDVSVNVSSTRPHPKGTVVDFLAEVRSGSEVVWESTSTYLRRGRSNDDADKGLTFDTTPAGTTQWQLPADLGRRYGAVSGDRNPIHLYPVTAKALGFPRQIAHGMWSLARCVAALENRLPDAVTVEVGFKKPILLPGTVAFGHEARPDGGQVFALSSPKDGAPHLVGRAVRA
ncbi:MaoC/PaaZ C-terminal domain-containing protein [Nocardioides aestuarii]|uniref:MaoC family dehydratase n=1 Tax=Nocardioides aestuarii TaxID=252231 RepID=A0ABW4TQF6_9ACTN